MERNYLWEKNLILKLLATYLISDVSSSNDLFYGFLTLSIAISIFLIMIISTLARLLICLNLIHHEIACTRYRNGL